MLSQQSTNVNLLAEVARLSLLRVESSKLGLGQDGVEVLWSGRNVGAGEKGCDPDLVIFQEPPKVSPSDQNAKDYLLA